MPMILKNTASRYGFISQFFHWLMALLIVMQFIWAWRIDQLGLGRERYELVNQHKSIGLTLLGLLCLRLAWRWLSPPPPLPDHMSYRQQQAARWVHGLIYLLLVMLPVVGWAMSSAAGFVVSWFDVFDLPALLEQNDPLKERLLTLHAILAWSLAVIVLGHSLAALHHHLVLKDEVLWRMLPGKRKS